jgi:hypothetical protein
VTAWEHMYDNVTRSFSTIYCAQTHTYQHAWKHPLSSSLAGSGIVNLCLSCVFFLGRRSVPYCFFWLLVTLFPLGDGGVRASVLMRLYVCDYLCGVERWWILFVASVQCDERRHTYIHTPIYQNA